MTPQGFRHALILTFSAALFPGTTQAHVDIQTIELLAGAIHPWINLDSGLALLGLVLWVCQSVDSTDLVPFFVIAAALATGDAAGIFLGTSTAPWLIESVAVFLALGVSFSYSPARRLSISAITFAALLSGWYAGLDAAREITSPTMFLTGVLTGGLIIPLAAGALLAQRTSSMLRIGIRVLGSWLAAVGLMLVALRFRT